MDIPFVPIGAARLEECLAVMREGNGLLQYWSAYHGKRRCKAFRRELFKVSYPGARQTWLDKAEELGIPSDKRGYFLADLPKIMAVRNIEWEMLCGFVNLARKLSKRWCRMEHNTQMEVADFFQEALIGLIDAIYGYRRQGISFLTFAWVSICNRLTSVVIQNSPLGQFNAYERALIFRYEDLKKKVNCPVTFDELMRQLDFTEEQARIVAEINICVINWSQIGPGDMRQCLEDNGNDLTSLRKGADRDETGGPDDAWELHDAIEKAGLSDFEHAVVLTSMYPYYGWQADIARQFVNPRTDKPYTRAGVAVALRNAQDKIKTALGSIENKEVA